MSLKPKKGRVAVSILGVYTPYTYKSFNTVNHNSLYRKLQNTSLKSTKLLKSYFADRKQLTVINGCRSDSMGRLAMEFPKVSSSDRSSLVYILKILLIMFTIQIYTNVY